MADADRLTTELATIREDFRVTADLERLGGYKTHTAALRHGSALLAVAEAVLALHQMQERPVRSYGPEGACPAHSPNAFGIPNQRTLVGCPDCKYTDIYVCSHCECPNDKWPCPTRAAISSALLGEAGEHG